MCEVIRLHDARASARLGEQTCECWVREGTKTTSSRSISDNDNDATAWLGDVREMRESGLCRNDDGLRMQKTWGGMHVGYPGRSDRMKGVEGDP